MLKVCHSVAKLAAAWLVATTLLGAGSSFATTTLEVWLGGVLVLPVSGTGPWKDLVSGGSGNDWVIPKGAKNPDLAWELIKLLSDEVAGASLVPDLGSPPANRAAAAKIVDPKVKFVSDTVANSPLPPLDSAMPNSLALFWYRSLQQAFALQLSPAEALGQVQQQSLATAP